MDNNEFQHEHAERFWNGFPFGETSSDSKFEQATKSMLNFIRYNPIEVKSLKNMIETYFPIFKLLATHRIKVVDGYYVAT